MCIHEGNWRGKIAFWKTTDQPIPEKTPSHEIRASVVVFVPLCLSVSSSKVFRARNKPLYHDSRFGRGSLQPGFAYFWAGAKNIIGKGKKRRKDRSQRRNGKICSLPHTRSGKKTNWVLKIRDTAYGKEGTISEKNETKQFIQKERKKGEHR